MAYQFPDFPNATSLQCYSQEEVEKVFAKHCKNEELQSHLHQVNNHCKGNVLDYYVHEVAERFDLEPLEVHMLFFKMNMPPAEIPHPQTSDLFKHIQEFNKRESELTEEARVVIHNVVSYEKGLDAATLAYGRELVQTFGTADQWRNDARFQHFQTQVLREKSIVYFSERFQSKSLPEEIKDSEALFALLGKPKSDISTLDGADLGPKVFLLREAFRKWLMIAEQRFNKKARESAVSISFMTFQKKKRLS